MYAENAYYYPDRTERCVDPLSETLSLLKLRDFVAGGFVLRETVGFDFPGHPGIKCYAATSGSCWLLFDGSPKAIRIAEGDCIVLPRGFPFRLTMDLSLPHVEFSCEREIRATGQEMLDDQEGGCSIIGGHFPLAGKHSEMLLSSLPAIVHIRHDTDKQAMRWSISQLQEEMEHPRPGGSLISQQLVYMMLLQAVRLHVEEAGEDGLGWLFALTDVSMRNAIAWMHESPGYKWTLQELANRLGMSRTVFAQKFKSRVGVTPMDYLGRWRMLLAGDRLMSSDETVSAISSSLGYETESAFGRAFRRFWGCSPREHRRRP